MNRTAEPVSPVQGLCEKEQEPLLQPEVLRLLHLNHSPAPALHRGKAH